MVDACIDAERQEPIEAVVRLAGHDERVRSLVKSQFDFVWRSLRRLGVREADTDDAAQRVFVVAVSKLSAIQQDCERAFLFSIALREASHVRRTYHRRRETPECPATEAVDAHPTAEVLVDMRRAREIADALLDELDTELRAVLVLFEVDEMPVPEIAALMGIPVGTAASRLRRAREQFQAHLKRFQARSVSHGGRS